MQVMIDAKFGRISDSIGIKIFQASLIFVIEVNAFAKIKEFINFSQQVRQFNGYYFHFCRRYLIFHNVYLSIYLFYQLQMLTVVL